MYPAVDRDVVEGDAALSEQFFHVAVGQSVVQVPAHRQHDDLPGELKPSEMRITLVTGNLYSSGGGRLNRSSNRQATSIQ